MTTGKISAVCGVPGGAFPAIKPGTTQNVAVGAASAQSAAVGGLVVRVVSSTDCHIAVRRQPDSIGDLYVPASQVAGILRLRADR